MIKKWTWLAPNGDLAYFLATGVVKGGVIPPFFEKDVKEQGIKKLQLFCGDMHTFSWLCGLSWRKDTEMAGILEYSHCFSILTSVNRQQAVLFYWATYFFIVIDVKRIMASLRLLRSYTYNRGSMFLFNSEIS